MPSLKAWEEGSRAPSHRQVVQGPALNCLSESGEACVADLVASEFKHLRTVTSGH